MSARSLSYTRPAPDARDAETVSLSRLELRELLAAATYLHAVTDATDASDPGEEPDDVLATRELVYRLNALADAPAPSGDVATVRLSVNHADLSALADVADRCHEAYSHGAEDDDELLFADEVLSPLARALRAAR